MRSIFEYFIKYVGSSALAAPGYMNMMPIIQFDFGLWYVRGGMYQLAEGMAKLMARNGHQGSPRGRCHRHHTGGKNSHGTFLWRMGRDLKFDTVVSNMEVVPTYEKLLGESLPRFMRKLDKFKPACSGIVIHLGTDRVYPELAHHNFIYSQNQHKHFQTVFEKGQLPEDPTLYVVAPTRTDPSKAPVGGDNIKDSSSYSCPQ